VLFGSFSVQRPQATIGRLTGGQFRNAVCEEKAVLDILPEQDKIRMQHYCLLHPQVGGVIAPLLGEQCDDGPTFKQPSFERWLKQLREPCTAAIFSSGDLS
jgi:hypothetical protein